ncbi:LamG-like jellyroll fold domain-containing protein, partial [Paenibacillus farraposensis]
MKCNKIANASLALIMFLVIILPIFIPTSLVRAADGVLDPETTNLSFDGVDDTIRLNNLPINSDVNGKNTVEFWMYWNGKNATMPFGWNTTYDLYFLNGYFGFNNGATIIGGITSTDLKNKWVHVAAVFPNGVPSVDNCEIYIDGQKQTLSPVGTGDTVRSATSSAFISGWGPSGKYKFEGKLAGFRIWNYARTATEIQADMNRTLTGQENGLVGDWRLDQVSTETAYDSSTHQNHGTSAGFVSLINPVVKFSTDQKISLDWDDIVPGVTYVLTRDGVVVYEGGDSFFVDKGLTPTTTYTYSLYTKSLYGQSKSVLTDKTNNNPAPAVPTHFTGVPGSNSVTLTWDTVPGATSYMLLRDGKTVYSGSDTTFTDNRLAGSTKYSYSLMAVNVESPGDPAFTEVTTKTYTPVEPVNFITTDGSDDTIKIINLPVNNTLGAKTTVEFWMYWNGKNYVKPFGWYVSNLYFANGYFGFNQGDGSVLGIPSAELKNKWVHVAAVFTNGAPTADTNELYINGEKQSISLFLTQQTESKTVTPMAVISGWGNNSNYKFAGKLAEVRIWNHARTAEDIQSDINRPLSGDEAGLIGAWNLDSLTTGIVYDVTKRNNNGVAAGFAVPPFNLQITEKTDQKMVLIWDKIANAETYVLKRNNSIIYQGPDSTFADTGLSPFTDYTYTLIARNSNGETNEAKIIDKTNKSVLPTPANIATTATNSSITLDWDNVAGATTYELKRDDVSIYSGSESKFIDSTGLAAAKTYTYTLIAKSSTGESSPASVQVKTADPAPATPANLTGTATTTSIKLSWDVVGYAQSYELQRDEKVVYSGSDLTYTDTGLTASTPYRYRLVAKNGTGESSPASLQVKTADPAPATPANLAGIATATSIMLSWDAVDNAQSYELQRDGKVVYTGSELTYTDKDLKESTPHTYRLVAKNGTGESSPALLQVKTADPTPTDPTPTTPAPAAPTNLIGTATTTSITLSWNAVADAQSYELQRDGKVVYTGSELTYTDSGLTESTNYTYRLVAKNGTGESSPASLQVKTADPTPTDPTPTTPAPAA